MPEKQWKNTEARVKIAWKGEKCNQSRRPCPTVYLGTYLETSLEAWPRCCRWTGTMQQAVRQFTRCGSARSREWSLGQGSLTFTWFAVAQGGLEVPAPTPQLLEAFSVEPQGSAGFFFRFKYSIQPAFSSHCSSPLLSQASSATLCEPRHGHYQVAAMAIRSSVTQTAHSRKRDCSLVTRAWLT